MATSGRRGYHASRQVHVGIRMIQRVCNDVGWGCWRAGGRGGPMDLHTRHANVFEGVARSLSVECVCRVTRPDPSCGTDFAGWGPAEAERGDGGRPERNETLDVAAGTRVHLAQQGLLLRSGL